MPQPSQQTQDPSRLLTPSEVCTRWALSPQTLRKWRMLGAGPRWIKLGDARNASIRYRLSDLLEYERAGEPQEQ